MVEKKIIDTSGETRGMKYYLKQNMQENDQLL